jgi:hypothetical protein
MPDQNARWETKIGLADMHGTVLEVGFEPPEDEEDIAYGTVAMTSGAARFACSPEPDALRRSAAALLDLAEGLEAHKEGS